MNTINLCCNKAFTYICDLQPEYTYHNVDHTKMVVEVVNTLFEALPLTLCVKPDLLKIAAHYHDTGYSNQPLNHEEGSCKIVADEMSKFEFNDDDIYQVQSIIMATKIICIKDSNNELTMNQFPGNDIFRRIICDADLYSFGSTNFFQIGSDLRNEFFYIVNKIYTDLEWYTFQLKFLQNHSWHTEQAKKLFDAKKQINLNCLFEKINNLS